MKYCSNKDLNQLIRRLVCQGWHFSHGSRHGRLSHPCGRPTLTVPKTPGDHRSFYNFRRDLRKALHRRQANYTDDHECTQLAK